MSDPDLMSTCPRCGAKQQFDPDGFGVLGCTDCGYCTHPSSTGNVCDICNKSLIYFDNGDGTVTVGVFEPKPN